MTDMFYQRRSFWVLLQEGTLLYGRHFMLLTKPLLLPIAEQLVGVFLWLVMGYGVVDYLIDAFPELNVMVLWVIFLLANIPGMIMFVDGFWRYLVWVSGLNLVVRDVVNGQIDDEQLPHYVLRIKSRSVDYSLLWLFLFGIAFVPLALAMLVQLLPVTDTMRMMLFMVSGAVVAVGYVVVAIMWLLFSLAFQVFAFSPDSVGLVLLRSMDLVQTNRVKTTGVVLVTLVMTQFVLPNLVVMGFDMVGILGWLGHGAGQVMHAVVLDSMGDFENLQRVLPDVATLWSFLSQRIDWLTNMDKLGVMATETIVFSLVTALLLPLSSAWFALLYADSKLKLDAVG